MGISDRDRQDNDRCSISSNIGITKGQSAPPSSLTGSIVKPTPPSNQSSAPPQVSHWWDGFDWSNFSVIQKTEFDTAIKGLGITSQVGDEQWNDGGFTYTTRHSDSPSGRLQMVSIYKSGSFEEMRCLFPNGQRYGYYKTFGSSAKSSSIVYRHYDPQTAPQQPQEPVPPVEGNNNIPAPEEPVPPAPPVIPEVLVPGASQSGDIQVFDLVWPLFTFDTPPMLFMPRLGWFKNEGDAIPDKPVAITNHNVNIIGPAPSGMSAEVFGLDSLNHLQSLQIPVKDSPPNPTTYSKMALAIIYSDGKFSMYSKVI